MVNNALALGIKAPQMQTFNPLQAALVASQLRAAENQNSLTQMQIGERQTDVNALADWRNKRAAGDPSADQALEASPRVMEQVFTARQRMSEAERTIFDNNLNTNARAVQDVLDAPPEQRAEVWKKNNDLALKQGRINALEHARYAAMVPDDAALEKMRRISLPIIQRIELEQKQADRELGRDIAKKLPALGQPAAQDAPELDYFETLKKAESGGNPAAKPPINPDTGKPASTATGLYQFNDATWAGVAKNNPDLGLTPEGRTDPAQQEKAVRALTAENAAALVNAKITPNGKNLYMAHLLGAPEAKTFLAGLKANPTAPATSLVSPEAVAANKSVFFDSAGQPKSAVGVYNSLTRKFGSDTGGAVDATAPLPSSVDPEAARLIGILPQLRQLRMAPGIPDATAKGIDESIKYAEKIIEPTNDIKNYQLVAAQAKAAGKTPMSFEDFQEASEKRKQQQVTVNAFANPLVKGVSEQFVAERDKARAAADDVRAIHLAREQVDQGIVAGAGADWRLYTRKIGSLLGVPDDKVTSTEAFSSQIGQRVVNIVKAFGAGTGISNADREYAEKMAGGQIKLDESSIRRILDIGERANRALLDRYNADAIKVTKKLPDDAQHLAPLFEVSVPGAYKRPEKASAASADLQDGQTASNPQTGEKLIRQNGKWVPLS